MSLSERPFLYDVMGGSVKTSFSKVVAVLSAASSLGFPFQHTLKQTVSISPRNPIFFCKGLLKHLGSVHPWRVPWDAQNAAVI